MLKKVCKLLSTSIIAILVIIGGLLLIPRLFGCNTYAIISGSMQPNITIGTVVYTHDIDFNKLEVGDIVSYRLSSKIVTHRIAEIDKEDKQVVTKGDANTVVDASPISESNIIGKVIFSVPLLGYISMYIKTPLGIICILLILILLIILEYLPSAFESNNKKENQ